MKPKISEEDDFTIYELPDGVAFKFVYAQAQKPDYAEDLVDSLNNKGGRNNK